MTNKKPHQHIHQSNHEHEILMERFKRAWKIYPKHKAKARAVNAWLELEPDEALTERIIEAIKEQKKADRWRANEDGGRWIPLFVNWINDKRWEDEIYDGRYREPDDSEYDTTTMDLLFGGKK